MRTFRLVWQLEWQRALRRKRLFRLNVIIPLLLVTPIAFSSAPRAHAAAVYTVLFALFGTFGAAIPALRDGEQGLIRRIAQTRLDMRAVLLARGLAGGVIDSLQLMPALLVIVIATDIPISAAGLLVIALVASLVFANLFGLAVAALARSVGEGALFAAVTTLLLLHASGVFRTPQAGSIGARVEPFAPYRALHELLLSAAPSYGVWAALLLLAVVTGVLATPMMRALAQADGQG